MKLKYTQVKQYREEQLAAQQYHCALCNELILDDAVLDHDHKSGLIRQVLHRGCNSMLGKIENNMPRSKMDLQKLKTFAENLIKYIETQHTEIRHPTHLNKDERYEKLTRKRIKNRKKSQASKAAKA